MVKGPKCQLSGVISMSGDDAVDDVRVGEHGQFILPWLTPGSYDLSLAPVGGSQSQTLATVNVREGEHIVDFNIEMETSGVLIAGTVQNRQGDPVGAARISLHSEHGIGIQSTSAGDGKFLFQGLAEGNYSISVQHKDYSTLTAQGVQAPYSGISLVLPNHGSVRGIVKSADTGKRQQQFNIARYAGIHNEVPIESSKGTTIRSDAGEFSLDDLEVGDNTLIITSEGHAPSLVHVQNVQENMSAGYVDVTLLAASVLKGLISDVEGNPVSGAYIHSKRISGDHIGIQQSLARTDYEGKFETKDLPAGTHTLMVSHPEYVSTAFSAELETGRDTEIEAVLDGGGTVTGIVYSNNTPIPNAMIMLQNVDGQTTRRNIQTDPAGSYLFEKLPAGGYRIHLYIPMQMDNGETHYSAITDPDGYLIFVDGSGTQYLDWEY